jgi:ethanolamine utilization cobalamin adenosyltransferase
MVVKLPIMENLALADKLRDIICQKSIVDVDTEDLPKERYHDRTFPKNFWKKKKAKRRIQKQSRKRR